jgi:hypothetical protein
MHRIVTAFQEYENNLVKFCSEYVQIQFSETAYRLDLG